MTATASAERSSTARSLRTLYIVRTAVSAAWVALVFAFAAGPVGAAGSASPAAAVLLVVYPLWDAAATFADIRASSPTRSRLPQVINIAVGVAAAIAMLVAVLVGGLHAAIAVFGIWALVSGAVQLTVALRRRRAIGGQWPMIISGGLSVLAGASFTIMSGMAAASLGTLAGYSAFGAFWYLVGAIWLSRSVSAE